jgi:hypothetical protein
MLKPAFLLLLIITLTSARLPFLRNWIVKHEQNYDSYLPPKMKENINIIVDDQSDDLITRSSLHENETGQNKKDDVTESTYSYDDSMYMQNLSLYLEDMTHDIDDIGISNPPENDPLNPNQNKSETGSSDNKTQKRKIQSSYDSIGEIKQKFNIPFDPNNETLTRNPFDNRCETLRSILLKTPFYDTNDSNFVEWFSRDWKKYLIDWDDSVQTFRDSIIDGTKNFEDLNLNQTMTHFQLESQLSKGQLRVYLNEERRQMMFLRNELIKQRFKKEDELDGLLISTQTMMSEILRIMEDMELQFYEKIQKYRKLKALVFGINFKMKHELNFIDYMSNLKNVLTSISKFDFDRSDVTQSLATQLYKISMRLIELNRAKKQRMIDLEYTRLVKPVPIHLTLGMTEFTSYNSYYAQVDQGTSDFETIDSILQHDDETRKMGSDDGGNEDQDSLSLQDEFYFEIEHKIIDDIKTHKVRFKNTPEIIPNSGVNGDPEQTTVDSDTSNSMGEIYTLLKANKDPKTTPNPKIYIYKLKGDWSEEKDSGRDLTGLYESGTSNSFSNLDNFDQEDPLINALNKELESVFQMRETLKKMLKMELVKYVNKIRKRLLDDTLYKTFRRSVQELSGSKKKIWDLSNEFLSLNWKLEELDSKLRINNDTQYKPKFFKEDFIKFKMQLNDFYFSKLVPITQSKEVLQEKILKEHTVSPQLTEYLKQIDTVDIVDIVDIVNSLKPVEDSSTGSQDEDITVVNKPEPKEIIPEFERNEDSIERLQGNSSFIYEQISGIALENELTAQLKLQRIYKHNSKNLDKLLATVFASSEYKCNQRFRCFNKAQLIYSIFMMSRSGVIMNLNVFLDTFLRGISTRKAIEFMVYVYGMLANKSFMKQLNSNFQLRVPEDKGTENVITEDVKNKMIAQFKQNINFLFNISNEMIMFTQSSYDNHIFEDRIGEILVRNINEKVFSKILDFTNYNNQNFLNEMKWFQQFTSIHTDELRVLENKINPQLYSLVTKLIRDWCGITDFLLNIPFMVRSVGKMFSHIENFLVQQLTVKFHVSNFHMRSFSFQLEKCKEKYYKVFQVELNFEDYIEDKLSERDLDSIGVDLPHESEHSHSNSESEESNVKNWIKAELNQEHDSENSSQSSQVGYKRTFKNYHFLQQGNQESMRKIRKQLNNSSESTIRDLELYKKLSDEDSVFEEMKSKGIPADDDDEFDDESETPKVVSNLTIDISDYSDVQMEFSSETSFQMKSEEEFSDDVDSESDASSEINPLEELNNKEEENIRMLLTQKATR